MKRNGLSFCRLIVLSLLIIVFGVSGLNAEIRGINIRDDEYAHFFQGAWMAEVAKSNNLEWWQSGLIVLGISVAKEVYDMQSTGFSYRDIAFDLGGVLVSYSLPLNFLSGDQAANAKKQDNGTTSDKVAAIPPDSQE